MRNLWHVVAVAHAHVVGAPDFTREQAKVIQLVHGKMLLGTQRCLHVRLQQPV